VTGTPLICLGIAEFWLLICCGLWWTTKSKDKTRFAAIGATVVTMTLVFICGAILGIHHTSLKAKETYIHIKGLAERVAESVDLHLEPEPEGQDR